MPRFHELNEENQRRAMSRHIDTLWTCLDDQIRQLCTEKLESWGYPTNLSFRIQGLPDDFVAFFGPIDLEAAPGILRNELLVHRNGQLQVGARIFPDFFSDLKMEVSLEILDSDLNSSRSDYTLARFQSLIYQDIRRISEHLRDLARQLRRSFFNPEYLSEWFEDQGICFRGNGQELPIKVATLEEEFFGRGRDATVRRFTD